MRALYRKWLIRGESCCSQLMMMIKCRLCTELTTGFYACPWTMLTMVVVMVALQ